MDLDRLRDGDVTSHRRIDADLGVLGRHLVVISGIACPNWKINDDNRHADKCVLHLRERVDDIEGTPAVFVGLASVANGESEYTFATDAATVDVDDAGELVLHTDLVLIGEWSALSRFSYQIVLTTRKVVAEISGTISWPTQWFRPPTPDPAGVSGIFTVVANRREITEKNSGPGQFGEFTEVLTPITPGEIVSVSIDEETTRAVYRIVEPPKGLELKVTVAQDGSLGDGVLFDAPHGDLVTLTVAQPTRSDIDFTASLKKKLG
ncbi:hypothetical protein JF780_07095 [Mycobacterium intracellulare]|jgi:hypothetical protein|uniref:hypothetical protein n=1 Tax=Mycobacterium TaxID=1763 RepID=UPI000A404CF4|nr:MULTISPECIES: hypothetical protein [Mycobacterium]MCA2272545.1 hypothetical protein [Mycobacterium intracellulare]MCA2324716.1 hypothetical protein [Mycobacterium intracellulare]